VLYSLPTLERTVGKVKERAFLFSRRPLESCSGGFRVRMKNLLGGKENCRRRKEKKWTGQVCRFLKRSAMRSLGVFVRKPGVRSRKSIEETEEGLLEGCVARSLRKKSPVAPGPRNTCLPRARKNHRKSSSGEKINPRPSEGGRRPLSKRAFHERTGSY